MEKKVPLTIDGKNVEASAGQTILECASENGIFIPTLCHYGKTTNVGACRVCVVEVENARSLVASCCMPVSPGHGYPHQHRSGAQRPKDDYRTSLVVGRS